MGWFLFYLRQWCFSFYSGLESREHVYCFEFSSQVSDNMPRQGSWLPLLGGWCEQMQEVAGERGGYLHGRGGMASLSLTANIYMCPIGPTCGGYLAVSLFFRSVFCLFFLFVVNAAASLGVQLWTVTIYSISRSRWKPRRTQNASFAVLKNGLLLHLRYPFTRLK